MNTYKSNIVVANIPFHIWFNHLNTRFPGEVMVSAS